MKKTLVMATLAMLAIVPLRAQSDAPKTETVKYVKWVKAAANYPDSFFTTEEARRVGDNVLLYQHTTGGWPKNVQMQDSLTDKERLAVEAKKNDVNESTIDNGATTTELTYLARLYNATHEKRYLDGFNAGMEYLFRSQYANGGWPQFWPRPTGYYTRITYNDDAMVNVLWMLDKISRGEAPYAFAADSTRAKGREAVNRGVECILKTQVKQNGKLTVWCAQHDEHTLQPAKARAYELPSLSGGESIGVVMFLMSRPNPSKAIRRSIEAAVEWFRTSRIEGKKIERYTNAEGKPDLRMVDCKAGEQCEPLWGRFYTLDTNRPFVCDRDGVIKYDLSEIGYERRNGYGWYNHHGQMVLKEYEAWKRRVGDL